MTSIQPELWVDRAGAVVSFYQAGFGARVMHLVGDGDDVVAQLSIGDAAFWVSAASSSMRRFSPSAIDGITGRTLLVVANPDEIVGLDVLVSTFGAWRNDGRLAVKRCALCASGSLR